MASKDIVLICARSNRTRVSDAGAVSLGLALVLSGLASGLLGGLLLPPATASAQTDDETARAREAYQRGQQAYEAGEYNDAEEAFEEAYEAVPNPVVLLGLAEARERNRNGAAAVEALELYLSERADAPDREEIGERIQTLRETVATLSITSIPSGADVEIDGEHQGVTPLEVEAEPGRRLITLTLDGHESSERRVTAEFATFHEFEFSLGIASDDVPEEVVPEEPVELSSSDGIGAGVWVAAGVSVAGLVAGTVLGFLALSEQSDFDAAPSEEAADRGERLALFADIGFAVAAAAGLTAIVLYATGSSDSSDSASLQVTPLVSPDGAGLGARGSF